MYYVYAFMDEGVAVYVGFGSGGRAWSTHRQGQPELQEWIDEQLCWNLLPNKYVEIVDMALTREEALELEATVIKEMSPKFNKLHNDEHTPISKFNHLLPKAVGLRQSGKSFSEIGEHIGVSTMTAWRMLNE